MRPEEKIQVEGKRLIDDWFRRNHMPLCHIGENGIPIAPMATYPNEAKRSAYLGSLMKQMGLLSGMPDLHLWLPPGLYMEIKSETGTLLKSQKLVHATMRKFGMNIVICRSANEMLEAVKKYMEGIK